MHTLGEIATLLDCPAPPDPGRLIHGLSVLNEAGPDDLSLIGSDQYLRQLEGSHAAAVIAQKRIKVPPTYERPVLRVDDADLAMSRVAALFAPTPQRPPAGVDPSARIATSAVLGERVAVGPFVVVGERTRIGNGVVIHPGVIIGDDVAVGDDSELFPNVVIRERIIIGRRVIIHAGGVIGSDGFGYRWDGARHAKVPQIGTVIIDDDVEIGSCACIDRARFSTTRIGRGTKIDNLVQVGHNAQIGAHCIICGQTGIAGSTTLGSGVVLGGQTAVRDHITINDGVMAAACSAIAEDVPPKTVVSGMPALPHRQSLREQGALRRLPELVVQVRKLHEEIALLKKQIESKQTDEQAATRRSEINVIPVDDHDEQ